MQGGRKALLDRIRKMKMGAVERNRRWSGQLFRVESAKERWRWTGLPGGDAPERGGVFTGNRRGAI